jgi:transposase-like protein
LVAAFVGAPARSRTGTPFNFLEMPTALVCQLVLFHCRLTLSLRDRGPMFLMRDCELSHETARDGAARFASWLADQVRCRRQRRLDGCW